MAVHSRQRELFPLPVLPVSTPLDSCKSLSRVVQRRVHKKNHIQQWKRDGLHTLNELSGYPFSDPPEFCDTQAQLVACEGLEALYSRVPSPPDDLTGAGALSELCASATRYAPTELSGVAPYVADSVSMPPSGCVPCDITQALGVADRNTVVGWETSMLLGPEGREEHRQSAERPRPFLEPSLVSKPEVYGNFLSLLDRAGMIQWRIGGPSYLGIFFVRKKEWQAAHNPGHS